MLCLSILGTSIILHDNGIRYNGAFSSGFDANYMLLRFDE